MKNANAIENEEEKKKANEKILDELRKGGDVGLPNKEWFSDHLPVGAVLEL